MKDNRIWIAWEKQRRSLELSDALKCKLFIIERTGVWRYPSSCLETLRICFKHQPDILFVQNPSMILAAIGCLCKILFRCKLIVDRHSNFLLTKKKRSILFVWAFNILNFLTLRFADLTIVTNKFIAERVQKAGGKAFILEDKLPSLSTSKTKPLKGRINCLLISSFHDDEPIEEALKAMHRFSESEIYFYISGDYTRAKKRLRDFPKKKNVIFTGFIDDREYIDLLHSVDVVVVLTTIDYCLLCGCYEAVSAEKPLVTSDTQVLRSLFRGAVFVKPDAVSISTGIKRIIENLEGYQARIRDLKKELEIQWLKRFDVLNTIIERIR